jgi:aerobic-type carbon monoxide dehydrogenase small subunit (CoxS/CutS family)
MTLKLNVNGSEYVVESHPSTPLLYVLRNELGLNGAKYGCGLGQCGACTVQIDSRAVFSCLTPIVSLEGRRIRTIEGLGTAASPSVLQTAFEVEQAAQCGYCIAGMIMRAQVLLDRNALPTEAELRKHMQPNLCRCGTHMRIIRAVRRALNMPPAFGDRERAP